MFSRVRWQLTAWYVAMLTVMLLSFAGVLYLGLEEVIWLEEDAELLSFLKDGSAELHYENPALDKEEGEEVTPYAAVWLMDRSGRPLKGLGTLSPFLYADQAGLAAAVAAGKGAGHTFMTAGGYYRSYTLPIQMEGGISAWAQAVEPAGRVVHVLRRTLSLLFLAVGGTVLLAGLAGLALANRALVPIRAAWQRQRDFASDASHELRTPLAVVQAAADLLRARIQPGDPDAEIMDDLTAATRRMRGLVEDLLLLARADSARLDLVVEPVNLAEAARSVVSQLRHLAEEREVALDWNGLTEVWLEGNRRGLEQVLTILVDNAIRYHSPPGWMRMTISVQRGRAVITVADNGPGIPAAALPRIFDRFFRATPAASSGSGLGLAIAKQLVEAHGGVIRVQSIVGSGTTFTVELPLRLSTQG